LNTILKFSGKKFSVWTFHLVVIDTDPVRPDPDRHSLDGDPDVDPAKNVEPNRIRIYNTDLTFLCMWPKESAWGRMDGGTSEYRRVPVFQSVVM
jgi:hypothetical protein